MAGEAEGFGKGVWEVTSVVAVVVVVGALSLPRHEGRAQEK